MAKKATAKSQMHVPQIPDKDKIVDAMLSLAADMPFEMVGLKDIAQESGLSLAALREMFEDKMDILAAYGRRLDARVLENMPKAANDLDPRDVLFDLLMDRFEAVNEDRASILSILNSFKFDPKEALFSIPHLGRSMTWMCEAAGVSTSGYKGAARVLGLTGVYLYALRTWREDESADLSKTMAALDKALDRTSAWASSLGL